MANILMIAAEASSVLYAERLMRHWQSQGKKYSYFGVGSQAMAEMGFKLFGRAEEMGVVGFSEAIGKYSELKKIYNSILAEIDQKIEAGQKPQVAVLLDYPGFNLRLAKDLKARDIKVVYYISPQIWAWKKGRIHTVKKYVDKMLVILPFEEDFYRQHDVSVEFVGHPLIEEIDPKLFDPQYVKLMRSQRGIPQGNTVLGLMPGSRRGELDRHVEVQVQVARNLYKKIPNLSVVVLAAPTVEKEELASRLDNLKIPYILLKDDPFFMIALTDYVLVASGTATLMVGLMQKPMVIMYKLSAVTAFIGRLLVKGYFGLVNLILQKEAVPEVFQRHANAENLTQLMLDLITNTTWQSEVRQDLAKLSEKLGTPGATQRAALAIEGVMFS